MGSSWMALIPRSAGSRDPVDDVEKAAETDRDGE
jgi:hypothetical protein